MKFNKLGLLLVTLVFFSLAGFQAHAEESSEQLFVATQEQPDEIQNYAEKNFFNLLKAKMTQEFRDPSEANVYSLGSPFAMLDVENSIESSYYPVLKDGRIEYTYVVSMDAENTLTGQLSQFLALELQEIVDKNLTSEEQPMTLFTKGNEIYYRINSIDTLLYKAPVDAKSSAEPSDREFDEFETEIINVEEEKQFEKPNNEIGKRSVLTGQNYRMINFAITETQADQSWCAAFAAAGILNNKNDKRATTAQTIMKWKYGNISYSQLKKKSISRADLIKYANSRKVYPKEVTRKLSLAEVKNQLNKSNAIYAASYGTGSYKGARHAFVVYGWVNYDKGQDAYYIWNPWWNYGSVIDANKGTLPVPGGSFVWDNTITNW